MQVEIGVPEAMRNWIGILGLRMKLKFTDTVAFQCQLETPTGVLVFGPIDVVPTSNVWGEGMSPSSGWGVRSGTPDLSNVFRMTWQFWGLTSNPLRGSFNLKDVETVFQAPLQHPVTIQSNPSGVSIIANGSPQVTPFQLLVDDGGTVSLQAPPEVIV